MKFDRFAKPSFKYLGTKGVVVPASSVAPVYLRFGDLTVRVTSNLECNLTTTGLGGLVAGSLEASKIYYLYAVLSERVPYLMADVSPPTEGLRATYLSTYIGAFPTTANGLPDFLSCNGRLALLYDDIEEVSHTGNTNWTSKTISMPKTAKFAVGMTAYTGATANKGGHVAGSANGTVGYPYGVRLAVANVQTHAEFDVPLADPNTIYLWTQDAGNTILWRSTGWIEDPSEYQ